MRDRLGAILIVALLAVGCSASTPAGSEATCVANCARMSCAADAQAPTGTTTGCDALCASVRATYPKCLAQIDAVSACVAAQIIFLCQDGGPIAVPGGVCEGAVQTCLTCTGDLTACSG